MFAPEDITIGAYNISLKVIVKKVIQSGFFYKLLWKICVGGHVAFGTKPQPDVLFMLCSKEQLC